MVLIQFSPVFLQLGLIILWLNISWYYRPLLHTVWRLLYFIEFMVEIDVMWAQRNSLGQFWALAMWAAQGNWLTIDFFKSHRLHGAFTWKVYRSVDIRQKYWCGSHQSNTVKDCKSVYPMSNSTHWITAWSAHFEKQNKNYTLVYIIHFH